MHICICTCIYLHKHVVSIWLCRALVVRTNYKNMWHASNVTTYCLHLFYVHVCTTRHALQIACLFFRAVFPICLEHHIAALRLLQGVLYLLIESQTIVSLWLLLEWKRPCSLGWQNCCIFVMLVGMGVLWFLSAANLLQFLLNYIASALAAAVLHVIAAAAAATVQTTTFPATTTKTATAPTALLPAVPTATTHCSYCYLTLLPVPVLVPVCTSY